MHRFDWVLSKLSRIGFTDSRLKKQRRNLVVLGTVAITGSWLHLLFETASAQQQPLVQQSLIKQRPRQPTGPRQGVPGGSQVRPPQPRMPRPGVPGGGNLYDDILNQLREQNNIGGTRGDLCLVSPPARLRDIADTIWHTNPIFIWRGTARRIELLDTSSKKVLWSKNLTPNDRIAVYDGQPLQPGEKYAWALYVSDAEDEEPQQNSFTILSSTERDRITAELNQLQTQGDTPEQIALKRANYFAEKRLWADALQEIYSVPNPSDQLKKLGEEITNYICQ